MPPRKSNASKDGGEDDEELGISLESVDLPRTLVQRLAKGMLPANTQIQKDALLAISKSATVFVGHLASHADAHAQCENRTIQPKDVVDALSDLGFGDFIPRVEGEFAKYNAVQCEKRNTYRRRVREEAKSKEGAPQDSQAAEFKGAQPSNHKMLYFENFPAEGGGPLVRNSSGKVIYEGQLADMFRYLPVWQGRGKYKLSEDGVNQDESDGDDVEARTDSEEDESAHIEAALHGAEGDEIGERSYDETDEASAGAEHGLDNDKRQVDETLELQHRPRIPGFSGE